MKRILIAIMVLLFSSQVMSLRIISLSPNITEMLYTIGAGPQLVAVDSASDFPTQVKLLPKVATFQLVNLEQIITLHPDIVFAWPVTHQRQQLAQLAKYHIKVIYDRPKSLADIAISLRKLGRLTGHVKTANAQAVKFLSALALLRQKYQHRKPVRVFYQAWQDPLLSVNDQSVVGQIINLCGGQNIFAKTPYLAAGIAVEAVLHAQPQVILVTNSQAKQFWQPWLASMNFPKIVIVPAQSSERYSSNVLIAAQKICFGLSHRKAI